MPLKLAAPLCHKITAKFTDMKPILIFLLASLFSSAIYSQTTTYSSTKGIAIKGYDPVAYFELQKAVEGNKELTFEWSGSKWRFVSQANLEKFKLSPQTYAPQYGGYCAYGCSENHKAPTDPNAFTIVGGKLYLNYNLETREAWLKDTASRIKTADAYWPNLNK
jgi:YHS domain-containing protein